jgi:hypothetical protein
MVTTRRAATAAVLVACLTAAPLNGTVAASEPPSAPPASQSSFQGNPSSTATPSSFVFTDEKLREALATSATREDRVPAAAYGQWGGHGGGHHHHGHNGASQAAIIFGSAAVIAGTGLLIYSNRPECDHVHSNDCYGEKVFGGSLLAGGIVSLALGITTWH